MNICYRLLAGLLVLMVLQTAGAFSQEHKETAEQPPVIVVTTAHANFDYKEDSLKDRLAC